MATPRIALVGCGYWGKNLLRNFAELGSLEVICDRDPQVLQQAAAAYPSIRSTSDLDEVLGDQDVDAVAFATPAARHFDHVKRALGAGKDVFVEKPLALRYGEGVELVELAQRTDRILMVGHILEYHPAIETLRKLVHDGELGELWYAYSTRANLGKIRQEENILWSFAPHDISAICGLAGSEPETVTASGGSYLQPGLVDVTTTILQFDSGLRAHIFVSWLHPFKEQKLVVVGDKKMAVFDDTVDQGKLRLYDQGVEWQEGTPIPRRTSETSILVEDAEPMHRECAHFLECVATRLTPRTDGASAARVLRVLEASQQSLESGGLPVALQSITPSAATR